MCQSACAQCHRSILNGQRHLLEIETHRIVPLPFPSDQPFGRYSRKGLIIWHHLARVTWHGATRDPQRILSYRATCWPASLARWLHPFDLQGRAIFFQTFTRRHVPHAMCHQSTHNIHHRRSGVLTRRMVPRRSWSDQPFGRYSENAWKHTQTDPDRLTNTVRPTIFHRPIGGNLRS